MQKFDLNELAEFNSKRFNPKVLINEPGYRMVLISLQAGQLILEHTAPHTVTVVAIRGCVSFFWGDTPYELRGGQVVTIDAGAKHRVHAHEDSVLLVLATSEPAKARLPRAEAQELDLRTVPRSQRHPIIFAEFDALAVGESLHLLNDHDPVPLHRQFDATRPGQAVWEYTERGPDLFRIRIRKVATANLPDLTESRIAALAGH